MIRGFLDNRFVRYFFMAFILFLIVYDFYYVPNIQNKQPVQTVPTSDYYCPDSKYVDAFGEKWTNEFWAANPDATIEDWTVEWNQIARAMHCSIYIRTPEEAQRTLDVRGKLP